MIDRLSRYFRMLKASLGITDRSRWSRNAKENPSWDDRNLLIAKYLQPNTSILDIGAGAQTLRRHAPAGCQYVPCDIVKSTPDSLLCDFNAGLYPKVDRVFDTTVCSGVMEYLRDPGLFLRTIRGYSRRHILSYEPASATGEDRKNRLSHGFVNNLTVEALEDLLRASGYRARRIDTWQRQLIYELHPEG